MALSTPIGYVDSSDAGDFQYIDSDGKTFLAYKAGQHLALSSAGGSLTKTSTGNTLIGSFTDTKYPNIGDSDTVSLVTTITSIYQDETVPSESDSDFTRPLGHAIQGNGQHYFKAMDDTNLNVLVDDLVERIFKYDMIGSYKLATSAPSGDYTVAVSNAMTDTRADGTSTQYNIYQRTSMTAPAHDSSDFPLILKDSDGSYSRKLIRMDSDQMVSTFGQRARKRIINGSGAVGTYQIRTSGQGAPTDTGTWVAKGSATDTRQAIAYSDYLGNFTADYLGNYLGDYARNFTRTRVSNYVGDYVGASSGGFASFFAGQSKFVGNYVGGATDFAGQGAYSAAYTRTSTQDFTRTSVYSRNFIRTSNYSRNFVRTSNYSRNFVIRTSNYSRNFTRTSNYSRNFTELFEDSTDYTRTSQRVRTCAFRGPSPGSPAAPTPYYAAFYLGNYLGNYLGPESGYFTRTFAGFVGNFGTPSTVNYSRTITRSSSYARNFFRTSTYSRNFVLRTSNYSRNFVIRTSNYTRDFTRTSNYVGNYVGNYSRGFLRQSARNYTRTSNQSFVGNYSGGSDPVLRQSNYLGTGRDGVSSNFSRFFTTTETAFTGTYTNTFTRNYIGNYTGGRVGPSAENIETYTLYVRVA
jgi:hypothetical protein